MTGAPEVRLSVDLFGVDVVGASRRLAHNVVIRARLEPNYSLHINLPSVRASWEFYRLCLDVGAQPWPGWWSARAWVTDASNTMVVPVVPALIYGEPFEVPSVVVAGATYPGDPVQVYAVMIRVDGERPRHEQRAPRRPGPAPVPG